MCKRTTITTLKGMCCDTGWGEDGVGAVGLPLPVAQSHDLSFRVERQDSKSSHRTTHVFPNLVSSTCEQGSGCAAVAKLLDWAMQVGLLAGLLGAVLRGEFNFCLVMHMGIFFSCQVQICYLRAHEQLG